MSENIHEVSQRSVATAVDDELPMRVRHDGDGSISTTVIEAVSEAADVDPIDIGTPLYDCIDPDALDALFGNRHDGTPRSGGRVVFELLDSSGSSVASHQENIAPYDGSFDSSAFSDGSYTLRARATSRLL